MNEAPERQDAGHPPRAMSLIAAFGWAIASVLALLLAAGVARSIQAGAEPDVISFTLCQLFGYSIVAFTLLRIYAPHARVRDTFALRTTSPMIVCLAVVVGLAMIPAIEPIDVLIKSRFPTPPEDLEALTRILTASTVGARARLVLGVGILSPIGQELFFRGMLFGRLRTGRSMLFAVAATALCETAATLEPRLMASSLVPALAFGFLRAQSGSVIPAVAGQLAYSLLAIAPILGGLGPNDDAPIPWRWSAAGAAAIILSLVATRWIATKSPRAAAALASEI